jgi:hypothetical protein
MKAEQFWQEYYRALVESIEDRPDAYALRPGETPQSYASKTAARMRL